MQLVISDHRLGLKAAIAAVFVGASWQRCRMHFMRNVLSRVPKAFAEMVAASIRTIFAQPDASVLRLITAVIVEAHDEWAVAERRYLHEESMTKLHTPTPNTPTPEPIKQAPLAVTATS